MNFKKYVIGLVAAAALAVAGVPAHANVQVMCAPDNPVAASNRTIGNTFGNSPVPSGSIYVLNGQGCAVAQQQDVGWFLSQGFIIAPGTSSIITTTGVLTGTTSVSIGILPANAYIQQIIVSNSTANSVTGGINFGTATSPAIIANGLGVANTVSAISAAGMTQPLSTTGPVALFAAALAAWNSANVTITVIFGYF